MRQREHEDRTSDTDDGDAKEVARAQRSAGADATSVGRFPARAWVPIGQRTKLQLKENHVSLLAAGVSFRALLAVVPAAVAAITIWGLVADPQQITDQIAQFAQMLPESGGQLVEEQLGQLTDQAGGTLGVALVVSLLVALWSASSGMLGLVEGIGAAYGEADTRSFLRRRALGLILTLAALIFLLISLTLLTALPPILDALGLEGSARMAVEVARWVGLAVLTAVGLAVIYRVGPDRASPRTRWVTWGAALATVVWLLGSAAFSLYVSNFGEFDETYGSLAGVVIVMLWVFLSAFAVLIGATVNAEIERQTAVDTTIGPERPLGERHAARADQLPSEYDPQHR